MNANRNFGKSNLEASFAASFTRTAIYGQIKSANNLPGDPINSNTLFNMQERGRVEQDQPESKIILAVGYQKGKWNIRGRAIRFGKAADIFYGSDRSLDEFFSPKIVSGLVVQYKLKAWVNITVGSRNILDVYPDKLKHKENTNEGINIYGSNVTQFGNNGDYYYVNMAFNW